MWSLVGEVAYDLQIIGHFCGVVSTAKTTIVEAEMCNLHPIYGKFEVDVCMVNV